MKDTSIVWLFEKSPINIKYLLYEFVFTRSTLSQMSNYKR